MGTNQILSSNRPCIDKTNHQTQKPTDPQTTCIRQKQTRPFPATDLDPQLSKQFQKNHLFRREIVASGNLLIQLLNIGEPRDDAEGAPVGLLAVELQLRLLHAPVLAGGPRHAVGGARGLRRRGVRRGRRLRRSLPEQRHGCARPSLAAVITLIAGERAPWRGRDDRAHTCAGDDCRTARCNAAPLRPGSVSRFGAGKMDSDGWCGFLNVWRVLGSVVGGR